MINLSSKTYHYDIINIKSLNKDISEITLKTNDPNKIQFLAGQYVYVYFSEHQKFPYSIASSPNNNHLVLLINNGTNNNIINFFKKNYKSSIKLSDAYGEAYYHNSDNNILAISKGLGISPILSIMHNIADTYEKKCTKKIILYQVVSSKNDLVFESLLQNLQQKIEIKHEHFITNGTYNLKGLFNNLFTAENNLNNYDFYVFGSSLFVLDIYQELLPYCKNNFYSDVKICM